ncbi:tRNA (adenosine(37)-N6)-threonylcarbamoyltransferase complex transferase subunit TsaD [Candidatus Saccharibacteria bacterium]|nr:tRNA (adenosine(37)-N6)-threonylcarbamoyltransferase complex transferase subunit TsaD [Candidatus Saccharibacteria bacterium]
MKILGIETSCDETAAAVVEDGRRLLSNVVQSQIDIHSAFGGVVPEVAARSHLEVILPVVDEAVKGVGGWNEIDAIAVATMPGLVGSLLIGSLTARTLALIKNKPLYPVHHVEAHVYANFIIDGKPCSPLPNDLPSVRDFCLSSQEKSLSPRRNCVQPQEDILATNESDQNLVSTPSGMTDKEDSLNLFLNPLHENASMETPERQSLRPQDMEMSHRADRLTYYGMRKNGLGNPPQFPMLALIVSGGHSQIVLFHDHGDYQMIGQTADDAVGEAFDKVAKILGLPYPGGPSIARAAKTGDPLAYTFPKAKMSNRYDFSFSGLKTAVLRTVQSEVGHDHTFPSTGLPELLDESQRHNFAASFQRTAVETLVDKIVAAYAEFQPKSVVIAGGVAANQELRRELAERLPIPITYPTPELCTDNAAMIASLGYFMAQKVPPGDPLNTEVNPSISMTLAAWNLS